ncbi:hypothetical protein D3C80_1830320 [compost metagenome]
MDFSHQCVFELPELVRRIGEKRRSAVDRQLIHLIHGMNAVFEKLTHECFLLDKSKVASPLCMMQDAKITEAAKASR